MPLQARTSPVEPSAPQMATTDATKALNASQTLLEALEARTAALQVKEDIKQARYAKELHKKQACLQADTLMYQAKLAKLATQYEDSSPEYVVNKHILDEEFERTTEYYADALKKLEEKEALRRERAITRQQKLQQTLFPDQATMDFRLERQRHYSREYARRKNNIPPERYGKKGRQPSDIPRADRVRATARQYYRNNREAILAANYLLRHGEPQ